MRTQAVFLALVITLIPGCMNKMSGKPVIIAHRGASGYLPEHTLECKSMAYAMGPDYLEQDVVLTRDDHPVVIHDHYLDTVSDVVEKFPARKRNDGRYYVIDFTLEEIKKLTLHERIDLNTGTTVYPKRFPGSSNIGFKIPTLEEEIELIQGLNKSTGHNIGFYTELKAPWFHEKEGKNIAKIILEIFIKYNIKGKKANCYIQCFDPHCLKYIRKTLKADIKLIQLIADDSWGETPGVMYSKMLTKEGIDEIAQYADGIGPWMNQVVHLEGTNKYKISDLVVLAHKRGLCVHPYTLRADELPHYVKNLDELYQIFFIEASVDGVFTDFPDRGVLFLKQHGYR